jgi:hypothetical protein
MGVDTLNSSLNLEGEWEAYLIAVDKIKFCAVSIDARCRKSYCTRKAETDNLIKCHTFTLSDGDEGSDESVKARHISGTTVGLCCIVESLSVYKVGTTLHEIG